MEIKKVPKKEIFQSIADSFTEYESLIDDVVRAAKIHEENADGEVDFNEFEKDISNFINNSKSALENFLSKYEIHAKRVAMKREDCDFFSKKTAANFDLPDVDEEEKEDKSLAVGTPDKTPTTEEKDNKPSEKTLDSLQETMQDINSVIDKLKVEERFKSLEHEILYKVEEGLDSLRKEFEEFKDKKMPKRKEYEVENAYRENLFTIATHVLDEVLPELFSSIPDYSLISTHISKASSDGTIENGVVYVKVSVDHEGFQYDFKIDVPFINGIAFSPLYLQRGLKMIPLTKEAIDEELESVSFKKLPVEDMTHKKNLFSNIGEEPVVHNDKQKIYPTQGNKYPEVSMPPSPRKTLDMM